MSKDYKPAPQRASNKGSPFFSGLLVGLLLGVGASLAVTMYLKGADSPFAEKKVSAQKPGLLAHEVSIEKLPKEPSAAENALPKEENPNKGDNKFDFYIYCPKLKAP